VLFQSRTRTVGLGEYPTYALRAGTWSRLWTSACGARPHRSSPPGARCGSIGYTACDV
jgi:hypothetical protein